jgi:hypothetical protein
MWGVSLLERGHSECNSAGGGRGGVVGAWLAGLLSWMLGVAL